MTEEINIKKKSDLNPDKGEITLFDDNKINTVNNKKYRI